VRLSGVRSTFRDRHPETRDARGADADVLDAMRTAFWLAGERGVWPLVVRLFDEGASADRILHAFNLAMRLVQGAA
jgi:hypothetical protein